MAIKIDVIRFFTTKLVKHRPDFWLEHCSNHAVDAQGASGRSLQEIIEKEVAAPGSSGCPPLAALPQSGPPRSFHESLDFEEPVFADSIAYVFTLPEAKNPWAENGAKSVVHHTVDLKFLPGVGVPTRFVPKCTDKFVHFGEVFNGGKSAWIAIDRKMIVKSSVATMLRDAEAEHMVVPVGFDIVDATVGISSWILPHAKARAAHGKSVPLFWHGGPHPPENTSITVSL